ncbi:MAG: hypothetical protein NTW07_12465 [candidate division Zixibacteria bacterium]|nr:hypothetical protein [candidate division Zixibacteria bacterium]
MRRQSRTTFKGALITALALAAFAGSTATAQDVATGSARPSC